LPFFANAASVGFAGSATVLISVVLASVLLLQWLKIIVPDKSKATVIVDFFIL
jgi:hypothetical protein